MFLNVSSESSGSVYPVPVNSKLYWLQYNIAQIDLTLIEHNNITHLFTIVSIFTVVWECSRSIEAKYPSTRLVYDTVVDKWAWIVYLLSLESDETEVRTIMYVIATLCCRWVGNLTSGSVLCKSKESVMSCTKPLKYDVRNSNPCRINQRLNYRTYMYFVRV